MTGLTTDLFICVPRDRRGLRFDVITTIQPGGDERTGRGSCHSNSGGLTHIKFTSISPSLTPAVWANRGAGYKSKCGWTGRTSITTRSRPGIPQRPRLSLSQPPFSASTTMTTASSPPENSDTSEVIIAYVFLGSPSFPCSHLQPTPHQSPSIVLRHYLSIHVMQ